MELQGHIIKPKSFWLITFADLLALLVAFFILLYSMTAIEQEQWDNVKEVLSELFLSTGKDLAFDPTTNVSLRFAKMDPIADLDYLAGVIDTRIRNEPALSFIQVMRQKDTLILSLQGGVLFEGNSADFTLRGISGLFFIENMVNAISNHIECIGYVPLMVEGVDGISPWSQTLIRTKKVAEELKNSGYSDNIPFFSKVGAKQALASNVQQIDIVIHSKKSTQN